MTEFEWDPDTYRALMAEEIPDYDRLQTELVTAVAAHDPQTVLDLGIGSGLTAHLVAEAVPAAHITGIDASESMLAAARSLFDASGNPRAALALGRLEDPLPQGPFDLVMSTLAIHHLDGPGKADLFARIAEVLAPDGRFVLADLIVPADPADAVTPIDGIEDTPSTLDSQLSWLRDAGLDPRVEWLHRDLAVVSARRRK